MSFKTLLNLFDLAHLQQHANAKNVTLLAHLLKILISVVWQDFEEIRWMSDAL